MTILQYVAVGILAIGLLIICASPFLTYTPNR